MRIGDSTLQRFFEDNDFIFSESRRGPLSGPRNGHIKALGLTLPEVSLAMLSRLEGRTCLLGSDPGSRDLVAVPKKITLSRATRGSGTVVLTKAPNPTWLSQVSIPTTL